MSVDQSERCDVLVAGLGPVGLSAAIACARLGLRVCAVGRIDTRRSGRTFALFEGSLRLFRALGVLEALTAESAALEMMRVVDDTGSLFRGPPIVFRAAEIGLAAFGRNIESAALSAVLAAAAASTPGLTVVENLVEGYAFSAAGVRARLEGRVLEARLLIAADGRNSRARAAARIATRAWSYPQTALTALFEHQRPHGGVSTEFHARGGPFTLVPLPGSPDAPHRSSLVWMMAPEAARRRCALAPDGFAREAERQAHSLLGAMRLASGVDALPMQGHCAVRLAGRRIALAGDAGHGLPPIGAQGLNLGLRDVALLRELLAGAPDPGGDALLERYARRRRRDVAARSWGVDLANRSLLSRTLPVDLARGAALLALEAIGPLRRAAMRAGLGPEIGRLVAPARPPGAA